MVKYLEQVFFFCTFVVSRWRELENSTLKIYRDSKLSFQWRAAPSGCSSGTRQITKKANVSNPIYRSFLKKPLGFFIVQTSTFLLFLVYIAKLIMPQT